MTTIKTQKLNLIGKYQSEKVNSSWVDYTVIAYSESHAKELFEQETGESADDYEFESVGFAKGMLNGQYFEPKVYNNN